MKKSSMKPLIRFGVNIIISIIVIILLTVTNLSVLVMIFGIVIGICDIKNTLYHAPNKVLGFFRFQAKFNNYWYRIFRAFIGWC